jgi:hypothetical protein
MDTDRQVDRRLTGRPTPVRDHRHADVAMGKTHHCSALSTICLFVDVSNQAALVSPMRAGGYAVVEVQHRSGGSRQRLFLAKVADPPGAHHGRCCIAMRGTQLGPNGNTHLFEVEVWSPCSQLRGSLQGLLVSLYRLLRNFLRSILHMKKPENCYGLFRLNLEELSPWIDPVRSEGDVERPFNLSSIWYSTRKLQRERYRHPCGVELRDSSIGVLLRGEPDLHEARHGRVCQNVYDFHRFPS